MSGCSRPLHASHSKIKFLSFSLLFLCLLLVPPVSVSGHPCSFAVCSILCRQFLFYTWSFLFLCCFLNFPSLSFFLFKKITLVLFCFLLLSSKPLTTLKTRIFWFLLIIFNPVNLLISLHFSLPTEPNKHISSLLILLAKRWLVEALTKPAFTHFFQPVQTFAFNYF